VTDVGQLAGIHSFVVGVNLGSRCEPIVVDVQAIEKHAQRRVRLRVEAVQLGFEGRVRQRSGNGNGDGNGEKQDRHDSLFVCNV
jgi:hypothetical protein